MIYHLYVPYQLNYGLIYKMSKNYRNTFPNFPILLSGDCETWQLHYDTDSQNLECGLHTDVNSIFPDFLLTFWWISKFPDPYENLLTFFWPFKIFTFFLTFSWPVGTLIMSFWPCYYFDYTLDISILLDNWEALFYTPTANEPSSQMYLIDHETSWQE